MYELPQAICHQQRSSLRSPGRDSQRKSEPLQRLLPPLPSRKPFISARVETFRPKLETRGNCLRPGLDSTQLLQGAVIHPVTSNTCRAWDSPLYKNDRGSTCEPRSFIFPRSQFRQHPWWDNKSQLPSSSSPASSRSGGEAIFWRSYKKLISRIASCNSGVKSEACIRQFQLPLGLPG